MEVQRCLPPRNEQPHEQAEDKTTFASSNVRASHPNAPPVPPRPHRASYKPPMISLYDVHISGSFTRGPAQLLQDSHSSDDGAEAKHSVESKNPSCFLQSSQNEDNGNISTSRQVRCLSSVGSSCLENCTDIDAKEYREEQGELVFVQTE